jgi:hypothetical protein
MPIVYNQTKNQTKPNEYLSYCSMSKTVQYNKGEHIIKVAIPQSIECRATASSTQDEARGVAEYKSPRASNKTHRDRLTRNWNKGHSPF